ncbi:MAG TPA: MFS transporter [Actinomycetota bacterium]|nr:MFS transporter [Actinomycetota bacterium]
MNRWRVSTVWLAMWATDGFFFHLMSTVFSVFLILELGLDPLQLVLMGTVLEVTYLVFEIPTGIVADAVSRKRSVVIGFLGTGVAFLVLASADSGFASPFAIAAISQGLWGVSATLISGADVAWLTDEVGEDAARPLYVRSEQYYNAGALLGIGVSVALASIALSLPIVVCGVGNILLGLALISVMRESRRPTRSAGTIGGSMRRTLGDAVRQIRAHHVLLLILATAVLHGASTEGWDRLSDLHFLRGIGLPPLGDLSFVVWFGILDGIALLLGIGALAYVRHVGHLEGHGNVAWLLMVIDILLIVSVVGFAVIGVFWVAVVLFWIVGALRSVRAPIFTAWLNQGLDTATRATINSIGGQADAVGQAMAGPVIGGVARGVSVPWALSLAGLLQLPILLLYVRAIRRGTAGTKRPEEIEPELDLAEE